MLRLEPNLLEDADEQLIDVVVKRGGRFRVLAVVGGGEGFAVGDVHRPRSYEVRLVAHEYHGLVVHGARAPQVLQNLLGGRQRVVGDDAVDDDHRVRDVSGERVFHLREIKQ